MKTSVLAASCFAGMLLLTTTACLAQVLQPVRYEREQKNSDDYFNVINLKEEGLALFRERDKFKNNNRIWELVLLDTALQERKVLELEIKERHKMIGYETVPGNLYFLFRTGETTKNDFELIHIRLAGEEGQRYLIKPDLDFKLTHFVKAGDSFVFGGYVNNDPAIFMYELSSGLIKAVPGFFQKDTELVDLRTNQNQTFNTVLVDRGSKGDRNLVFRTFDSSGKQLLEDKVPIEENRTLQTGISSALEREELVVLGTWGERNSKQSTGFFSLVIDPFGEQQIKYFDFGQLTHFVDYLNAKRAARIKEDSKADREAGRIPSFVNYVMPFKVTEYKSGFLMLAEVYTPSSNLNPYYNNPYYYNPYAYSPYGYNPYWPGYYYPGMSRMYRPYAYGNNGRNNEDVKFNESILVAFDAQGNVMWDQSMKMEELKGGSIEQVSDAAVNATKVDFMYKKESELMIKSVTLKDDMPADIVEKIKTQDPVDEIRSEKTGDGGVRLWYNNAFYVWGYQTIRNSTREERVRDVFYINKVVVH